MVGPDAVVGTSYQNGTWAPVKVIQNVGMPTRGGVGVALLPNGTGVAAMRGGLGFHSATWNAEWTTSTYVPGPGPDPLAPRGGTRTRSFPAVPPRATTATRQRGAARCPVFGSSSSPRKSVSGPARWWGTSAFGSCGDGPRLASALALSIRNDDLLAYSDTVPSWVGRGLWTATSLFGRAAAQSPPAKAVGERLRAARFESRFPSRAECASLSLCYAPSFR